VLLHLRHEHGVIPHAPLTTIAEKIGLGMTRANTVLLWAGIVGVVCLVIGATILSIRLAHGSINVRRFIGSMVPLTTVWVTLFAFWMGARGARFQRTKRVMLEVGYCPHCGYDLKGLAPDPQDDATVGWRIPAYRHRG
jgi:hypothetical protein